MLREPPGLPIWLGLIDRELAVGIEDIRIPLAPFASTPTRRGRWDIAYVDDFSLRHTRFWTILRVPVNEHGTRACQRSRAANIVEEDLGETAKSKSAEGLAHSSGLVRR